MKIELNDMPFHLIGMVMIIIFLLGVAFNAIMFNPKFEQYEDCVSQTQNQEWCFEKFIEREL